MRGSRGRGRGKLRIKPLEWIEEGDEGFIAFGCFGTFEVMRSGNLILPWTGSLNDNNGYDGYEEKDCATLEEAKAYCNELHEKQIREAWNLYHGRLCDENIPQERQSRKLAIR